MSRLNVGRFERLAGLLFDVKGPGALTEIEDGIFATFPIDLRAPTQYWLPQGFKHYGRAVFLAAVAGQYSFIGIQNPVGSGKLATVISFGTFSAAGTSDGLWLTSGTPAGLAASASVAMPLDTRQGVGAAALPATCSIIDGNSVTAALAGTQVAYIQAGQPYPQSQIVLAPGDTCIMRSSVVNQNLLAVPIWVERDASPGELTI